jgi:hypothetical protein
MTKLITAPNMQDLDDFYAELLKMHDGKSTDESSALNAKLILLMANHIGNLDVLREAISTAADGPK